MLGWIAFIVFIVIICKTGSFGKAFNFLLSYILLPIGVGFVGNMILGKWGLIIGFVVGLIVAFKIGAKNMRG